MTKKIKILIADDHQMMIDGLKALLINEPSVEIAGEANSGADVLKQLQQQKIQVVLADINMPGMSGIELTREIKENHPETQVLALTMHKDNSTINEMLEAGANGYILKSTGIKELMLAITTVAQKGNYLSAEVQNEIIKNVFNKPEQREEKGAESVKLTKRESEILNLIAKEYTNAQIADQLFISERTVETHRKNIFTKTKTKTIIGLITYAINHKLISH